MVLNVPLEAKCEYEIPVATSGTAYFLAQANNGLAWGLTAASSFIQRKRKGQSFSEYRATQAVFELRTMEGAEPLECKV